MERRTLLALFASSGLCLSACTATDMQAAMGKLNSSLSEMSAGLNNTGNGSQTQGVAGTSLTKTKLMGVLARAPSTDGSAPEWPKIAITELRVSEAQVKNTDIFVKSTDCVQFDAVLWHDARHKETFHDVTLCGSELPRTHTDYGIDLLDGNEFVTTWRAFTIRGKTTGQVRGEGPEPPLFKLPSRPFPSFEIWLSSQGMSFIGSMLTMMGYDPQFTADDRRFWIKSARTF